MSYIGIVKFECYLWSDCKTIVDEEALMITYYTKQINPDEGGYYPPKWWYMEEALPDEVDDELKQLGLFEKYRGCYDYQYDDPKLEDMVIFDKIKDQFTVYEYENAKYTRVIVRIHKRKKPKKIKE